MGTGKTTLGRALARDTGLSFYDLDLYIEQRYHKSVSRIFSESGEQEFRKAESRILHEIGEFEDVIVSCGGSTPLFFDNMDYMRAQGTTLWLQSSEQVLLDRLKVARMSRPLIAAMDDAQLQEYISKELARRSPFYDRAEYRYCGDRLESAEQVAESVSGVRKLLNI